MVASISGTIFLNGILAGVAGNFGPFSRIFRSASVSGLVEMFMTQ